VKVSNVKRKFTGNIPNGFILEPKTAKQAQPYPLPVRREGWSGHFAMSAPKNQKYSELV
jgi:hypothetical protein